MKVADKKSSNERVAKLRANEKLKKEIERLQFELEQIPAERRYRSRLYKQLVAAWNRLNPDAQASAERPNASRLSGSDATARGAYFSDATDDGLAHRTPAADGDLDFGYGVLAESPTHQGIRDNCPEWVSDASLLRKFHDLLLAERLEEFPAMSEEQTVFTIADINLLKAYYLENWPFSELQFVSNGPISRRVVLDIEADEETVKDLQKRIRTLTNDGYRLLKRERPASDVLKREAREVREILEAKAQYGCGTDPNRFERRRARLDYRQDQVLQKEYRRLAAADAARQDLIPGTNGLSGARFAVSGQNVPLELLRLSLLAKLQASAKRVGLR